MDTTVIEPPPPPAGDASAAHPADADRGDLEPPPAPQDQIVAGVCSLIAQQLGLDSLWVRIGFVVLALTSGVGVVVYAALWLILIAAPRTRWTGVRALGGVILVAGVPLALHVGNPTFIDRPFAIVALLIGLALALWQPQREREPQPTPSVPRRPSRAAASPAIDAIRTGLTTPRRRHPPRQRSPLGRTTLGIALVAAAVGAIIDQANGGRFHPEQWLGVSAGLCGAGMLVGTVRGRARWLIVPAVAFAAAGYVGGELARVDVGLDDLQGGRHIYVSGTDATAGPTERVGFGDLDVNIAAPPLTPRTYDARVVFGDIWVSADETVAVDVRIRTDGGAGYTDRGRVADGVVRLGPSGPADVTVDAWVAHGNVYLTTYRAEPEPPLTGVAPDARSIGPTEPIGPRSDTSTPDGLGTVPTADPFDGPLIPIDEHLTATTDGRFIIVDGTAVIDLRDRTVTGEEVFDDGDGGLRIVTEQGEFELLGGRVLVRPDGDVVDLHAVRDEIPAGGHEQP